MPVNEPNQVLGFLERCQSIGNGAYRIIGWARSTDLKNVADLVILKDKRGAVLGEVKPSIERRDIRDFYSEPSILCCGWLIELSGIEDPSLIEAYVSQKDGSEKRLEKLRDETSESLEMFAGFKLKTLIDRGLKVGKNFSMQPGCFIDFSHCWLITIGDNVIFAPRVQVIAHDASLLTTNGAVKIGIINIGDNVFIGNGAIILPGVSIGSNAIVGAGSVVTKSIPSDSVYAGNPARFICTSSALAEKNLRLMERSPIFSGTYTIENGIDEEKRVEMIRCLSANGGLGYIVH